MPFLIMSFTTFSCATPLLFRGHTSRSPSESLLTFLSYSFALVAFGMGDEGFNASDTGFVGDASRARSESESLAAKGVHTRLRDFRS
jgi:hypothetical protein